MDAVNGHILLGYWTLREKNVLRKMQFIYKDKKNAIHIQGEKNAVHI